jgi:hypothetical protein
MPSQSNNFFFYYGIETFDSNNLLEYPALHIEAINIYLDVSFDGFDCFYIIWASTSCSTRRLLVTVIVKPIITSFPYFICLL